MKQMMFKRAKEIPKEFWQNRDWYYKQFSWYPHTVFPQAYAAVCLIHDYFPFSQRWGGCFIEENAHWFYDNNELCRVRQCILERCKRSPVYANTILKNFLKAWKTFMMQVTSTENTNLQVLSDKKLCDLYETLVRTEINAAAIGYIADSFLTSGTEDWLQQLIAHELKKKVPLQRIPLIVETLTYPTQLSFVNEEKICLLKIGVMIEQDKRLKQTILECSPEQALACLDVSPRIKRALQKHAHAYYWMENNYWRAKILSWEHFMRKVVELLKKEQDIKQCYTIEKSRAQEHQQRKKKTIQKYGVRLALQNIIYTTNIFTKIQDTRKQGVMRLNHFIFLFCKELARRLPLSFDQALCLIPPEVTVALLGRKIDYAELDRRKKKAFLFICPNGYTLLSGKAAENIDPLIFFSDVSTVTHVSGVVACKSSEKIIGRVRVIMSGENVGDLKKGEILVTNNTTPDFVPAMQRAAAIVTEQGGVTTHAAIVSRELNTPCIIGTKIATKVFKTGDLVEVDTEKGEIRKIPV